MRIQRSEGLGSRLSQFGHACMVSGHGLMHVGNASGLLLVSCR